MGTEIFHYWYPFLVMLSYILYIPMSHVRSYFMNHQIKNHSISFSSAPGSWTPTKSKYQILGIDLVWSVPTIPGLNYTVNVNITARKGLYTYNPDGRSKDCIVPL